MTRLTPPLERLDRCVRKGPPAAALGAILDYVAATGGRGRPWPWRVQRLRAEIEAWRCLEHALRKNEPSSVTAALAQLDGARGYGQGSHAA